MEAFIDAVIAGPRGLDIGLHSDSHANIPTEHGGKGSNKESPSRVWGAVHWVIHSEIDKHGEENTEHGQIGVLFLEELDGARLDSV